MGEASVTLHRRPIELLIVDMDNTLFDWVEFFVPAFYAMVDVAADLLSVDRESLLDDLQAVHRARGSAEHPFALLETNTVSAKMRGLSPRERHDRLRPAFDAFDLTRAQHLRLYPGVRSTLAIVRATGCPVVAHTESNSVNVASRLRMLELNELLDAAYAPQFVGDPHPTRRAASEERTLIRLLPAGARKPDPEVALSISAEWDVSASDALYVGDSLTRDIAMARAAGMHSAWALYGTHHAPEHWDQLVRVSHWPASSVSQHGTASPDEPETRPDVVLDSFGQLLDSFQFRSGHSQSHRGTYSAPSGELDASDSQST